MSSNRFLTYATLDCPELHDGKWSSCVVLGCPVYQKEHCAHFAKYYCKLYLLIAIITWTILCPQFCMVGTGQALAMLSSKSD